MDRQIIYPGQIPLETDLLNSNRYALIGLSKLAAAVLGNGPLLDGLACTPVSPAALQVQIGAGAVYALANLDGAAYSSLAADTGHSLLKQGLLMDAATLDCPAPATAGNSVDYLVQAGYFDQDGGAVALPYYNAANPAQAYSGPDNSGTAQHTVRQGVCRLAVKAGIAAASGSQTAPAPDPGYVGAYIVTVANGQSAITAADIGVNPGAPFIDETLTQKISQASGDARYALEGVNSDIIALNAVVSGTVFRKNAIINGNFDIWQRNTSFPLTVAGSNYTADRWLANIGTTGNNATISRQAFTLGQSLVPNEPAYWLRYAVTAYVGGNPGIEQRIEGVRTFAGRQITASFWAKADAARVVAVEFGQIFGTGGTPSTHVQISLDSFNLTTSWRQFSVTFMPPSISGKTLGVNGDDCLQLIFKLPGAVCTIDLAQVQFEASSSATAFELPPPQQTLALCQRYYEKTYAQAVVPGAVDFTNHVHHDFGISSSSNGIDCRFKVTKRSAPTVIVYSFFTGVAGTFSNGVSDYTPLLRYIGDSGFQLYQNVVSTAALGFHYTANAEL